MALKIPQLPKRLQFIFAVFALTIIFVLIIVMFASISQKASDLVGLQEPTAITNCTDTDGGNLPTTFGTCTDASRQVNADTCVATGTRAELKLQEFFCEGNVCTSKIEDCPIDFSCSSGTCTQS